VIGGQTPIDVNVAYTLPFEKADASIYLNVQNVFNVLPPDFATNNNNYDPLGRFYRLGIRGSLVRQHRETPPWIVVRSFPSRAPAQ